MNSYIYHYTSLNTLALMLANSTIRFNCLSNVDDMEEGKSVDLGNLADYAFVSCWTSNVQENIALWNMYTPNMSGVRIGLKQDFLKPIRGIENEVSNITDSTIWCYALKNFFSEIEYCEDCHVKIFKRQDDNLLTVEGLELLGTKKHSLWKFQQEVRFLLFAISKKHVREPDNWPYPYFLEAIIRKKLTDIEYIDMIFDRNVFNEAEILLGPKSTLADETIVQALISHYLPGFKGKVLKSELRIR